MKRRAKRKRRPKPAAAAEKVADAPKEEKPKPPPRPPADLRLKVLKKFYGKFLPRGPLRDRHRSLMARWNSGEDHGGVTVEELKSLYEDWKSARASLRARSLPRANREAATGSALRLQKGSCPICLSTFHRANLATAAVIARAADRKVSSLAASSTLNASACAAEASPASCSSTARQ